ncbi:MAG: hypothetical protein ACJA2Z_000268 [Candidatus Paceibacteria bacterium]|jgi:hypothetical protein
MKNKKTIKNVILGLVGAVCALIIYAVVSGGGPSLGETGSNSSLSSLIGSGSFGEIQEADTDLANAEILRILGSIQNISLDDDIFKNPVFQELEDSRFTIPKPVRIGRPNPFRPIGFDSGEINLGGGLGGSTPEETESDFFEESL